MKKEEQTITRRAFLKSNAILAGSALLPLNVIKGGNAKEQPNILWITSEDNSPLFGCYGDPLATTPNLDRLAERGVRYTNAYATAPVCAPTRNTIITGMYASALGNANMRSTYPIPESIKFYPQYLRAAGYYCTNNSKEDYNTIKPDDVWDESSDTAHYKNRKPGQPFFAIFNLTVSHESQVHYTVLKDREDLKHDPDQVKLPPYHPDTPEMRHCWAHYYDKVSEMDRQAGEIIKELEDAGLAEDTIVFYYSDHGGVLPRSKRFLYNSGTHVPFIIHFPEKYRHLAPGKPGTTVDRMISFVDLAPTLLSLAGVPVAENFQGHAFLGSQKTKDPKYVLGIRNRMDERIDLMRSLRDERFLYIRNYMPHRPYGQYLRYLWRMPATRSWEKEYLKGRCNEVQSRYWQEKPAEELYDVKADPHNVNNLANDPKYKKELDRFQSALREKLLEIRDLAFIPESDRLQRAANSTIYETFQSSDFPLERVIETAEFASDGNPDHLNILIERLSDDDSAVRYWAAIGCRVLKERAKAAKDALLKRLDDQYADVRIAAAEALFYIGETGSALNLLIREVDNEHEMAALHAINVLTAIGEPATPATKAILRRLWHWECPGYVKRSGTHFIKLVAPEWMDTF